MFSIILTHQGDLGWQMESKRQQVPLCYIKIEETNKQQQITTYTAEK